MDNLGQFVVLWRKGSRVLAVGQLMVRQDGKVTHYTVQYSTVQYSTVQYSTVQYSTADGAHAPGRQGNSFCPLKYAVSYPNILPIEPHASSQ